MKIDLEKLKAKFPAEDVEWRIQRSGLKDGKPWALVLAYIDNRAIMDRLDEVCGPENWLNRFTEIDGGFLCEIGIHVDEEWIWKGDGAPRTNIEPIKGGLSDAMKRAGYQWGIGRYLYSLEAGFADFHKDGKHRDKIEGKIYRWNPPKLPKWALPDAEDSTSKKPPKWYETLARFGKARKKIEDLDGGPDAYYECLKAHGVEKSNQFETVDDMMAALRDLANYVKATEKKES